MGILHLIRGPVEGIGLELARRQAETEEVTVVLIQEGVRMAAPADIPTLALAEDARAWGILTGPHVPNFPNFIDAPELVRLLETHERVFVW
jgi:sulfur transfer complex TusBCD TusB component (DsrH family)